MTNATPRPAALDPTRRHASAGTADSVVFSAADISSAVGRIAARIRADSVGRELLFVAVLKGAIVFAGDLMRALGDQPMMIDFMAVSSYGNGREAASHVRLLKDLDTDPAGRHILLVEDIVDEGLTLEYLMGNLRSRGPASVRACALLDKPFHRKTSVAVDYVGLTAPDAFLVGYGLDHQELHRNLPYICKLPPPP